MKIEESKVILGGRHEYESECKTEIRSECSFRSVLDGAAAEVSGASPTPAETPVDRVRVMLEKLIAEMLALISGQRSVRLTDIEEVADPKAEQASGKVRESAPRRREFVWQSELTESIREHERSEFSASGEIRSADGRVVNFDLDLAMCRDFQCTRKQVEQGRVVLRDPLVINFDGQASELGDRRFDFDLDNDGRKESIHELTGNSGLLSIDRNGDGRINDGSELFGALSGNGFADLAALDSDGNHWIDEADAGFSSLRVWSPGSDGTGTLAGLKEKGVGALFLGSTETPFALKDDDNRMRGQVRASGLYLLENGRPGTLQQVDVKV